MKKYVVLVILGVIVAVIQFLGFPRSWEDAFYLLAGVAVVGISYFSSVSYCSSCGRILSDKDSAPPHETPQQ